MLENWWNSLELFEKILWCITLPASIVFVIQMIMTFIGMDADGDLDGDSSEQPFELFTFRNFINFFIGFGWTGIVFHDKISSKFLLVTLAVVVGVVLVALVMYIFVALSKMQQSGNMDINNAINQIAVVYLTIPGNKSASGKIHVRIQGTLREVDAVTEGDTIESGKNVTVVGVINESILIVKVL